MKEAEVRPQALFNRYLELAQLDLRRLLEQEQAFVTVDCPACHSSDSDLALRKLGLDYRLCGRCGSLYASPRPGPGLLADFYRDAESVRFWSSDFFKKTAEARRKRMFRPRAELVAGLVREGVPESSHRLVDIGAGFGIFLEEVARTEAFDDIVGIEPGPDLAAVSRERGFEILQAPVEDIDHPIEADVATCFEVLEHVFDPALFLHGVRRTLKPGGILVLTTLTVTGFDIQVLWERSKSVFPPHHLNLMSVRGIELLAGRCGLEVVEVSTPGQLDLDIVANMMEEDPGLEVPRFVRQLVAAGNGARAEFQQFLQRHRLSSHLRLIATRA